MFRARMRPRKRRRLSSAEDLNSEVEKEEEEKSCNWRRWPLESAVGGGGGDGTLRFLSLLLLHGARDERMMGIAFGGSGTRQRNW